MTHDNAKRGLWIVSIASIVIGAILALWQYGTLIELRSINLIGLVYIMLIGLYALGCVVRARVKKSS